eukprot:738987-Karenia_brevis.AAC.1
MAKPTAGSWRILKKVARYLAGATRVVWKLCWQDEAHYCGVYSDRGVWMLGDHCINTWSAAQGAYALSSAEAEFYGMAEAVTRAKGLLSLARE